MMTRFLPELRGMIMIDRDGAIDDMLQILRDERVLCVIETRQMVDADALNAFGEDVVIPRHRDLAVKMTATLLKNDGFIIEHPLEKVDNHIDDSQFRSADSQLFRTSVEVIRRKPR